MRPEIRPRTVSPGGAGVLCLLLLLSCSSESGNESEAPPQQQAFARWLADRPILRRGGNGKIDTEVLAIARSRIPQDGSSSWSEDEALIVWARFENLSPRWTWKSAEQPVWVTLATRSGRALEDIGGRTDPDGRIRKLLGATAPPAVVAAGDRFVVPTIFALPDDVTEDLVAKTFTRLPDGKDFELVAVLIPANEVARPALHATAK